MNGYKLGFAGLVLAVAVVSAKADDAVNIVRKAVERSALNRAGTKPFHLKATLTPSKRTDVSGEITGEVEIWWSSPTVWRREVKSPAFRQTAILNGTGEWQKSEGDYFPEWLRRVSIELINPVPPFEEVLKRVKGAESRSMMGTTYWSWAEMSTDGIVQKGMGASIAVNNKTGLLLYGGGLGWGGEFRDYQDFHGRAVARTVISSPVAAKVTILEDLGETPAHWFDAAQVGGDAQLIHTEVVEERELRKNIISGANVVWPPLPDGPLEGVLTTAVVIDRAGKVREVGTIVSDNPGLTETAKSVIDAMQFRPYQVRGIPVQVVSRITMPFKTTRPAGVESLESARSYFEHGRLVSFPSAGTGAPYTLRASFEARGSSGTVEQGQYTDIWMSAQKWKREALIGKSRYVRSKNGDKSYEIAEGPDAGLLSLIFRVIEPVPSIETFVESDWRVKRDSVDGVKAIRVLSGYESPEGKLDPEHARGYWFAEDGSLLKAYFNGLDMPRSEVIDFHGAKVARKIRVLKSGSLAAMVNVTDLSPTAALPDGTFDLPGHESKLAFTDQAR